MIQVKFTGLNSLAAKMKQSPNVLTKNIKIGLGKSMLMAETEAKRRTPVDTSNLRSSIAGAGGYKFNNGLQAGFGTNVKYAFWVEVRKDVKHRVGEWGYMEKGAKAATPFIQKIMSEVMGEVATSITSI